MQVLNLLLSPIDHTHMKVIPLSYGGSLDVALPYEGLASRRTTILKALNVTSFDPQAFTGEGEQDWMVQAGFLDANRKAFHPKMQATIGKVLYQTLFPSGSKTRDLLQGMIYASRSASSREQVLIQLEIEADVGQHTRLFEYPWELLHNGRDFLAARGIALSRYIAYEDPPPSLLSVKRMNVLLVSSTAYDPAHHLDPLHEEERQAILDSLREAEEAERIHLHELKPATFNNLRHYVLTHTGEDTPYVIHFDGHGHFGMVCNTTVDGKECKTFHPGTIAKECQQCGAALPNPEGYLLFEHDAGGPDYISAQEVGSLLGLANRSNEAGRGIALVVLSACKSSLALMEDSVFNGVAQNLIANQLPAVVGMALSVSVEGAKKFADVLYLALSQEKSLAQAINWGREAMGFKGNQWYRPVLYLRWKDNQGGQLFATDAKRNQSSQDTVIHANNVPAKAPDPIRTPANTVQKLSGSPGSKSREASESQNEFRYDAFISYSHKDSDWVKSQFLPGLEQAGLRICIDYRDFEVGAPSLDNMEKAIDLSHKTLLILTPNWIASEWTGFESLMLQTQDPTNLKRRLLPLMVQRCTLPKRLKIFTYLDLTKPTEFDSQMLRLLLAIHSSPGKPGPIQPPPAVPVLSDSRRKVNRLANAQESLQVVINETFNKDKVIWQSHCERVINAIKEVEKTVSILLKALSEPDSFPIQPSRADKMRLENISADVKRLLMSLGIFKTICPPSSTEVKGKQYDKEREDIRVGLNKLLDKIQIIKTSLILLF